MSNIHGPLFGIIKLEYPGSDRERQRSLTRLQPQRHDCPGTHILKCRDQQYGERGEYNGAQEAYISSENGRTGREIRSNAVAAGPSNLFGREASDLIVTDTKAIEAAGYPCKSDGYTDRIRYETQITELRRKAQGVVVIVQRETKSERDPGTGKGRGNIVLSDTADPTSPPHECGIVYHGQRVTPAQDATFSR